LFEIEFLKVPSLTYIFYFRKIILFFEEKNFKKKNKIAHENFFLDVKIIENIFRIESNEKRKNVRK